MPANLSPEYYEADDRFRSATTDEERLAALRDMLSAIPKHKGTEKMQADLKSRIAKLKKGVARSGGKKKGGWDPSHVPREGAGQVVMVGAPNAGKSALVDALTNAEPEVAAYPFTTQVPLPAMMRFENVQVQLVDAPPVSADYMPGWLANLVRIGDVAALVASAGSDGCLENIDEVLEVLAGRNVHLVREPDATLHGQSRRAEVRTLMVVTQMDRPGAEERLEILEEFYGDRFELLCVCSRSEESLAPLRRRLFELLDVVRVVTKAPGKPPETDKPFTLPRGSTVEDLARFIHKDIARNLMYARIWGEGYYPGQKVPRDHPLEDLDVVELRS